MWNQLSYFDWREEIFEIGVSFVLARKFVLAARTIPLFIFKNNLCIDKGWTISRD